ncbi:MAG: DUF433 domain-containing protein [Verrucomicrobiales bacterium]|nr:DUF433 domain-containing protein [Verrucomicrobiales bacterium]
MRTLLASLAEGASVEELVADFPSVSREAVSAVIAFASASAGEEAQTRGRTASFCSPTPS